MEMIVQYLKELIDLHGELATPLGAYDPSEESIDLSLAVIKSVTDLALEDNLLSHEVATAIKSLPSTDSDELRAALSTVENAVR